MNFLHATEVAKQNQFDTFIFCALQLANNIPKKHIDICQVKFGSLYFRGTEFRKKSHSKEVSQQRILAQKLRFHRLRVELVFSFRRKSQLAVKFFWSSFFGQVFLVRRNSHTKIHFFGQVQLAVSEGSLARNASLRDRGCTKPYVLQYKTCL